MSRQRQKWKERWFLRPFRLILDHPVYWALNRRNVTRAFALGLFISFVPIPGTHIILVTLLALLFRLNIPSGIAGTMLTNPLTMLPLFFLAYLIGCHVLGIPPGRFRFEMTWDWVTTGLLPIWKPFALGCFIMGTASAVLGYLILGGVWHLSLVMQYRRRKAVNRDS